jgi:uncharacterized protein YdeI (YjbR/CyaY-like superfamily)
MTQEATPTIRPKSRADWRKWLQKNHITSDSVWLIYHKKNSKTPSLPWDEAVEEALCFGWIDSKRQAVDETTFRQFFGKRKSNSTWSKINKEKVERLIRERLMTKAGLAVIENAKKNGSWTILDDVEELIVPPDLGNALKKTKNAAKYFTGLSRSNKRAILLWLVMAKRPETRQKRIDEVAAFAGKGMMPQHLQVRPLSKN